MCQENSTSGRYRGLSAAVATVLVAVMAGAMAASLAPAAYAKDNPEDFTRVYRHTYDEVWDATHDAIERNGWFVTDDDKDKGIIHGNADFPHWKTTFEVHIETVSSKPEPKMTIKVKSTGVAGGGARKATAAGILEDTQKVLATYK